MKVVDNATSAPSPGFTYLSTAITLKALSNPSCPAGDIAWTFEEKPAGSSIPNPPNGATATITPDKLGRYVVKASCGGTSKSYNLYAYKVIFEWDSSAHISIEAKKGTASPDVPAPWGGWSETPPFESTPHAGPSIQLRLKMWIRPFDYNAAHGGGWTLQPSGESSYFAYVDVGDASMNATVEISLNATGSATSAAALDIQGALKALCSAATQVSYVIACVNGVLKPAGKLVNKITSKQSLSGKVKVGLVQAGVAFKTIAAPGPVYWEADCKNNVEIKVTRP